MNLRPLIVVCILLSFESAVFAQAPDWLWADKGNCTKEDKGAALAVDAAGNAYVTGSFIDSISFSSTTLYATGPYGFSDMFIAKWNSSGQFQWAKSGGGLMKDEGVGIDVDKSGNIYVTGYFQDTASFETLTVISAGGEDIFLARYDSIGNLVWLKRAGGIYNDHPSSKVSGGLVVDREGHVIVSGRYDDVAVSPPPVNQTCMFDTIIMSSMGAGDGFVAKYKPDGNVMWVTGFNSSGDEVVQSVGVDTNGNIYAAGGFSSSVTAGGTSVSSFSTGFMSGNVFVAKMDSQGSFFWMNAASGNNPSTGPAGGSISGAWIAVDKLGNSYLTGSYMHCEMNFGQQQLPFDDQSEAFIAKYDPNGAFQWAKNVGGLSLDAGTGICTDPAGNVYVSGFFGAPLGVFGSDTLMNNGGGDIFITSFTEAGNYRWTNIAGGTSPEIGYSIRYAQNHSLYLTGFFHSNTIAFSNSTLTNSGNSDMFVGRLDVQTNKVPDREQVSINIFPNPNDGIFTISCPSSYSSVTVTDIHGKIVYSQQVQDSRVPRTILVPEVSNGVYFLHLAGERLNVTKSFKISK